MIFNKRRSKVINSILSLLMTATIFMTSGTTVFASPEAAQTGVYVKQMDRGYCTLASAVDMMRSKMYIEGNTSWPNVTQQKVKSTAWKNGVGLYHQFTYYGMTVTYSTSKCNTQEALINLLNQYPEGIEIYIRDLPHAVLLTRYDAATDTFYVADPVYEGEIPLMKSWQRKAGSTQNAVIRTIDAYWYISKYENKIVPGGLVGEVPSSLEETEEALLPIEEHEILNDDTMLDLLLTNQTILDDKVDDNIVNAFNFTKSTIQLPYVNDYETTNFIDVDNSAWYASSIKAAYEMAMMIGISDTEFHVNGNITLAQTICVAARIHSKYYNNNYNFVAADGEPWFMPYVTYAKEQGIINDKYIFSDLSIYDREALRIEFSEILSKSLPEDQMTMIKKVESISDVPAESDDERFNMIYDLYNAGILIGDGEGFKPWQKITRAEIAAIISRMADASLRIE